MVIFVKRPRNNYWTDLTENLHKVGWYSHKKHNNYSYVFIVFIVCMKSLPQSLKSFLFNNNIFSYHLTQISLIRKIIKFFRTKKSYVFVALSVKDFRPNLLFPITLFLKWSWKGQLVCNKCTKLLSFQNGNGGYLLARRLMI